jgi:hypothetical protein
MSGTAARTTARQARSWTAMTAVLRFIAVLLV